MANQVTPNQSPTAKKEWCFIPPKQATGIKGEMKPEIKQGAEEIKPEFKGIRQGLKGVKPGLKEIKPEIDTALISCPVCSSKNLRKFGVKKAKLQKSQKYHCKDCGKIFTLKLTANKTYPTNVLLNTASLYNTGYSQAEIMKILSRRFRINPSQKTISNWIEGYKEVLPFSKLRQKAKRLFAPEEIIEKHEFLHNSLLYKFQIHRAKLELLFRDIKYNNQFVNQSKYYQPLKDYLEKIPTDKFPHHIFQEREELKEDSNKRASEIKFETIEFIRKEKQNLASRLASLGLMLASSNRDRHNAVQSFMMINDTTTIAAEVPVYLTHDDLVYFHERGIAKSITPAKTPITGHIDLLQIRNGLIHILDYKPEACKTNPIEQLTIYALGLASRTKLALSDFKCAWFDDKNYYEFFPLHTVYQKRQFKI